METVPSGSDLVSPDVSIRPVVLCGGAGSRLWPLSRSLHPKQLLALQPAQTMLQATVRRTTSRGFEAPIIVTGEAHRFLVREQLRAASIVPSAIILEPDGRNTAAAIALACHFEAHSAPDRLMLVMPADHVIGDEEAFRSAIAVGVPAAQDGAVVTFGIQPTRAETGYGYIEAGPGLPDHPEVLSARQFVEKPDAKTAEAYLASGRHFWNGGIFLFKASTLINELNAHAKEIATACDAAMTNAAPDDEFLRPQRQAFLSCPSISIDYSLMEKTDRAAVVPVEMAWSDLGSWDALWEISQKDGSANAVTGDVVAVETSSSLIRSESDATIATLGVKDMVIVATRDAILVAPRDRAQDLKILVNALDEAGVDKQAVHPRVHRRWGSYEIIDRGDRFRTKRVILNAGEKLSLQVHHQRSEHWIVVEGAARAFIDGQVRSLQEGESTFVPAGCVHQLENIGEVPLHLIEVQCGSYIGDEDVVRLDDQGRFTDVA